MSNFHECVLENLGGGKNKRVIKNIFTPTFSCSLSQRLCSVLVFATNFLKCI